MALSLWTIFILFNKRQSIISSLSLLYLKNFKSNLKQNLSNYKRNILNISMYKNKRETQVG